MRLAPRLALARLALDARELGYIGERIAAGFLRRRGHTIVARRLDSAHAELDLLTRRGPNWCCVEVKTGRLGERYSPGMRLGPKQLARLRRAAAQIARQQQASCQVDLVEICLDQSGALQAIRHHKDLQRALPRGLESPI